MKESKYGPRVRRVGDVVVIEMTLDEAEWLQKAMQNRVSARDIGYFDMDKKLRKALETTDERE